MQLHLFKNIQSLEASNVNLRYKVEAMAFFVLGLTLRDTEYGILQNNMSKIIAEMHEMNDKSLLRDEDLVILEKPETG